MQYTGTCDFPRYLFWRTTASGTRGSKVRVRLVAFFDGSHDSHTHVFPYCAAASPLVPSGKDTHIHTYVFCSREEPKERKKGGSTRLLCTPYLSLLFLLILSFSLSLSVIDFSALMRAQQANRGHRPRSVFLISAAQISLSFSLSIHHHTHF